MKPTLHALWSPTEGSSSEGELLLWAEGLPRRTGGPGDHPAALSGAQLVHTLWQLWRSLPVNVMSDRTRKQPILLPTRAGRPVLSTEPANEEDAVALDVWRVDVCAFAPAQTLTFLLELPEISAAIDYGPSLRYWRTGALLIAAVAGPASAFGFAGGQIRLDQCRIGGVRFGGQRIGDRAGRHADSSNEGPFFWSYLQRGA